MRQGKARVGAHAIQHLEPAHQRHHQVEDQQLERRIAFQFGERLGTIVHEGDCERPLLELGLDDPTDVRLVVGDEDMERSGAGEGTHGRRRGIRRGQTSAAMLAR
jgi:hypothetical protein